MDVCEKEVRPNVFSKKVEKVIVSYDELDYL